MSSNSSVVPLRQRDLEDVLKLVAAPKAELISATEPARPVSRHGTRRAHEVDWKALRCEARLCRLPGAVLQRMLESSASASIGASLCRNGRSCSLGRWRPSPARC